MSESLQCAPSEIKIGIRALGKPFLEGGDIEFSLSHSAGWIALVWNQGRALGVDIQEFKKVTQIQKIAERIFSLKDQESLVKADHSPRLFFKLWTQYEAALKSTGSGFQGKVDFSKLSFFSLPSLPENFFGTLAVQGLEPVELVFLQ